jgi:hypothetical protein
MPARKSAFIRENENPAAQLMLDPPSALRRFCAASHAKGTRTFPTHRRHRDKTVPNLHSRKTFGLGCGLYFLEFIILRINFRRKCETQIDIL